MRQTFVHGVVWRSDCELSPHCKHTFIRTIAPSEQRRGNPEAPSRRLARTQTERALPKLSTPTTGPAGEVRGAERVKPSGPEANSPQERRSAYYGRSFEACGDRTESCSRRNARRRPESPNAPGGESILGDIRPDRGTARTVTSSDGPALEPDQRKMHARWRTRLRRKSNSAHWALA